MSIDESCILIIDESCLLMKLVYYESCLLMKVKIVKEVIACDVSPVEMFLINKAANYAPIIFVLMLKCRCLGPL